MNKKILKIICVILIFIFLKLLFNIIFNNFIIKNYNKGKYLENQSSILVNINYFQKYIAYYNYGNILYKNGKYEKAIDEYKKALQKNIPQNKECKIRINYALAICKTVNVDESEKESIENAIKTYESAIDILVENGCASKDNEGHSEIAENLKKDIETEIDRLKNLLKDLKKVTKKDENNKKENNSENIEEEIQNIKEEAIKQQRKKEEMYKKYDKTFKRKSKNW